MLFAFFHHLGNIFNDFTNLDISLISLLYLNPPPHTHQFFESALAIWCHTYRTIRLLKITEAAGRSDSHTRREVESGMSDCLRVITVEWEEEVHRGDVKKATRLTAGVGGRLNVCVRVRVCVFAWGHSVSVGTVWYANPILINVWDGRIVVEPQSQSAQDPHCSLRASSVPFLYLSVSIFLSAATQTLRDWRDKKAFLVVWIWSFFLFLFF